MDEGELNNTPPVISYPPHLHTERGAYNIDYLIIIPLAFIYLLFAGLQGLPGRRMSRILAGWILIIMRHVLYLESAYCFYGYRGTALTHTQVGLAYGLDHMVPRKAFKVYCPISG